MEDSDACQCRLGMLLLLIATSSWHFVLRDVGTLTPPTVLESNRVHVIRARSKRICMECAYLQKRRNRSRVIYRRAVDPRLMPFITASTATTCYIGAPTQPFNASRWV